MKHYHIQINRKMINIFTVKTSDAKACADIHVNGARILLKPDAVYNRKSDDLLDSIKQAAEVMAHAYSGELYDLCVLTFSSELNSEGCLIHVLSTLNFPPVTFQETT